MFQQQLNKGLSAPSPTVGANLLTSRTSKARQPQKRSEIPALMLTIRIPRKEPAFIFCRAQTHISISSLFCAEARAQHLCPRCLSNDNFLASLKTSSWPEIFSRAASVHLGILQPLAEAVVVPSDDSMAETEILQPQNSNVLQSFVVMPWGTCTGAGKLPQLLPAQQRPHPAAAGSSSPWSALQLLSRPRRLQSILRGRSGTTPSWSALPPGLSIAWLQCS